MGPFFCFHFGLFININRHILHVSIQLFRFVCRKRFFFLFSFLDYTLKIKFYLTYDPIHFVIQRTKILVKKIDLNGCISCSSLNCDLFECLCKSLAKFFFPSETCRSKKRDTWIDSDAPHWQSGLGTIV